MILSRRHHPSIVLSLVVEYDNDDDDDGTTEGQEIRHPNPSFGPSVNIKRADAIEREHLSSHDNDRPHLILWPCITSYLSGPLVGIRNPFHHDPKDNGSSIVVIITTSTTTSCIHVNR